MSNQHAPQPNPHFGTKPMPIAIPEGHRPDLGALLKQLREWAGVTRREAADILGCTSSKIGDLENARSNPKPAEADLLLVRYAVPAAQRAQIITHVRQQSRRTPRGTYSNSTVSPRLRRIVEFEAQAVAACYYSNALIPAPLQTKSYAEALVSCTESDLDKVADLASFQVGRARLLYDPPGRPPLRYRCFLGEAVLHTKIGNNAVMLEQLTHLRTLATNLPNLDLHLVPFDLGSHVLLGFSPTLYYFRKPAPPQLVSEAPGYRFTRHHAETTRRAIAAFDQLATTALNRRDTVSQLAHQLTATSTSGRPSLYH